MADVLPKRKQVAVLNALVEGCSVRSTSRMPDVSIPTVLSLLVRVGEGCATLHDRVMRDLGCTHVECDEIWGRQEAASGHGRRRRSQVLPLRLVDGDANRLAAVHRGVSGARAAA